MFANPKIHTHLFQFTCPSRSTTRYIADIKDGEDVSIHVPLAEHDRNISYIV